MAVKMISMKKLYCILTLICCLLSCNEKIEQKQVTAVDGTWYTSMTVDYEDVVEVYITFDRGDFVIYQKSGTQMRFFTYKGTFTYTGGILSGRYEDSTPWGAEYIITLDTDEMMMENAESGEVNIYDRAIIPEDVLQDAVPALTTKADGTDAVL